MIVIIVSHPTALNYEAEHINELFRQGMELFHLRKPDYSLEEMEELLKHIKPEYHHNIALHQHHQLSERYNIKRIHFSEDRRRSTSEFELREWKQKGFALSTSIHAMEDHDSLSEYFDYTFFGPVFESITKPGYKPGGDKFPMVKAGPHKTKIIAIGGVTPEKMMLLNDFGFDGVALLGAIWDQLAKAQKN